MGAPSLRVITNEEADFSMGEALLLRHGTEESNKNSITSIVSLYLHWSEYGRCSINFTTRSGKKIYATGKLAADDLLNDIDYLFFTPEESQDFGELLPDDKVVVIFEVFQVGYAFKSAFVARSENNVLAFTPPEALKVQKMRRLRRLPVTKTLTAEISNINLQKVSAVTTEIGADSIVLSGAFSGFDKGQKISIKLDGVSFQAEAVRIDEGSLVARLNFSTGSESYNFFKTYQKVAFPTLVSFFSQDPNAVVDLYEKVGYFNRYASDGDQAVQERRTRAVTTWQKCTGGDGKELMMQVALKDNSVVGSSTLMKYFQSKENEVWFFTQMGLKAEPDLFEQSHALYQWRLEALMIRPEKITAMAVYSSEGKWLNKMWTKFCVLSPKYRDIFPIHVDIRQCKFELAHGQQGNIEIASRKMGETERSDLISDRIMAGLGPDLLNISGLADSIIDPEFKCSTQEYEQIASSLLLHQKKTAGEIFFWFRESTTPAEYSKFPRYGCNRWMYLEKEELPDLYGSFEHTIAVYRRKNSHK